LYGVSVIVLMISIILVGSLLIFGGSFLKLAVSIFIAPRFGGFVPSQKSTFLVGIIICFLISNTHVFPSQFYFIKSIFNQKNVSVVIIIILLSNPPKYPRQISPTPLRCVPCKIPPMFSPFLYIVLSYSASPISARQAPDYTFLQTPLPTRHH